jgi:PAS domain S-box-containing protein
MYARPVGEELTALHATARLVQQPLALDDMLRQLADVLPRGLAEPELAAVAVSYGGKTYGTRGTAVSVLESTFTTASGARGKIEVTYREPHQFGDDERVLVESVGDLLCIAIDRRDALHGVEQLSERLDLFADAVGMGVWEWDVTANHVTWCESVATMTGVDTRASVFGTHRDLVHPEDRSYLFGRLEQAARGDDDLRDVSFRFRRPEGGWRHMLGRARILREPGQRAQRILVALVDVSERRLLEEGLRNAQKLEALGQLASGVAHDFNNILMVLTTNGDLLRQQLAPDHKMRQLVDDLLLAGERGMALVGHLLAFARTSAFRPSRVDVGEVVAGLQPLLARIAKLPIVIALELDRTTGSIWADRVQVEQVILNLVVNARDAMPSGGLITLRVKPVVRDDIVYSSLEVADQGVGIPDDIRARLFDPFFTTKTTGKGIGLAVVASVTRQWGGIVEVDSTVGVGSTFRVLLPVMPA